MFLTSSSFSASSSHLSSGTKSRMIATSFRTVSPVSVSWPRYVRGLSREQSVEFLPHLQQHGGFLEVGQQI